jgi:hypothetical protein
LACRTSAVPCDPTLDCILRSHRKAQVRICTSFKRSLKSCCCPNKKPFAFTFNVRSDNLLFKPGVCSNYLPVREVNQEVQASAGAPVPQTTDDPQQSSPPAVVCGPTHVVRCLNSFAGLAHARDHVILVHRGQRRLLQRPQEQFHKAFKHFCQEYRTRPLCQLERSTTARYWQALARLVNCARICR